MEPVHLDPKVESHSGHFSSFTFCIYLFVQASLLFLAILFLPVATFHVFVVAGLFMVALPL